MKKEEEKEREGEKNVTRKREKFILSLNFNKFHYLLFCIIFSISINFGDDGLLGLRRFYCKVLLIKTILFHNFKTL